jgi:hypothetical protein
MTTTHHRPEQAVEINKAETLRVLALLPGTAHFTSKEAAIYIGTTADVLRVWRSTGRGPRFKGRGYFVRYAKSDLDAFMGGYDHRFGSAGGQQLTSNAEAA